MGKIKYLLLFFFASSAIALAEVVVGMTEAELIAEKGKPATKATVGNKSIFRWADMEVTLWKSEVVVIKVRDLEAERLDEEKRLRAIEEAKAREAAWVAANPPSAAPAAPQTFTTRKSAVERARERTGRAHQILQLKQNIESQTQLIALYSAGFSTPNRSAVTAAQRDAAQALIVQCELEIEVLERAQVKADLTGD